MEEIKISNFANEYRSRSFPDFVSLNKQNCSEIIETIKVNFSLSSATNGSSLVNAIDKIACFVTNRKFVGADFKLNEFLSSNSIKNTNLLLINWYRFDRIDKLSCDDLNEYFYDIWYPEADDIDIFDETLSWIISIRHDGRIKLLRKSCAQPRA